MTTENTGYSVDLEYLVRCCLVRYYYFLPKGSSNEPEKVVYYKKAVVGFSVCKAVNYR